ncbi:unnamed protein product, partial [Iphiclides podalirius]
MTPKAPFWLGSTISARRHSLEKQIVTGQMDGRRALGRAPTRWADVVKNAVGGSMQPAVHAAYDRTRWRRTSCGHDPQY